MKRLALIALLATVAVPAAADMTVTAGAITWTATGPLADVQEARDAVLWERMNRAFLGAIFTAALPNLAAVDNGNGTGTLRIAMPRPAADTWLTQYVDAGGCGESPTTQETLDCVDAAILGDILALSRRHRQSQVTDPGEVEIQ